MKSHYLSRRDCLRVSALAACSVLLNSKVSADQDEAQAGAAGQLQALMEKLTKAPRRRSFRTVPMTLDRPDLWDAAALDAVIGYSGRVKQVSDNTEIGGPWLNAMRNALNTQVFSFRNPDFLEVSATHGSAQLALYDQEIWTSISWPGWLVTASLLTG